MNLIFSGTIKQVGATLLQPLTSLMKKEKHLHHHSEEYGIPMWVDNYHPDYGLPSSIRLEAVLLSNLIGVKKAAEELNVSKSSIYKWRKSMENTNARLYRILSR